RARDCVVASAKQAGEPVRGRDQPDRRVHRQERRQEAGGQHLGRELNEMIEDKAYPVTPASVMVKVGIITGEVIDLKVTERVEKGTGRVVSPAKLTGTLRLENSSSNRTVLLVEARLLFMDVHGQPIKLEAARTETVVKFSQAGDERLD